MSASLGGSSPQNAPTAHRDLDEQFQALLNAQQQQREHQAAVQVRLYLSLVS